MKHQSYFFVIDAETGGIPQKLNKKAFYEVALKEIAVYVIDSLTLKIIDNRNWILRPYKNDLIYELEADQVSQIDRHFCVNNGLPLKIAFKQIIECFSNYKTSKKLPMLVGHNIPFDCEFLYNMFEYMESNLYDYVSKRSFDTCEFARLSYSLNNYKLLTCCQHEAIELVDAHRASGDAKVTALLFIIYCERLRHINRRMIDINQYDKTPIRKNDNLGYPTLF